MLIRKGELNDFFALYKLKPREEIINKAHDEVLQYLLDFHPDAAHSFHLHDSLLQNKPDEVLNEDEKKEAWKWYAEQSTSSAKRIAKTLQDIENANLQASLLGKSDFKSKYDIMDKSCG